MQLGIPALLAIVPLSLFVPGFVALRRFALPDELRLTASVGASLALLFLAGFAIHLTDAGAAACLAVLGVVLVAGVVVRKELGAFVRSPAVASVLIHWVLFALWVLLATLFVRSFSGGGWAGDWVEHYERALFFLGQLPIDHQFIGLWSLAARPPLQNVVVAFFMRLTGTDYSAYQLASALLATLQFLAAAALLSALQRPGGGHRHRGLLVLLLLLALNPSVIQNATFTWTRPLANFFVLLAAAFYVHASRGGSPSMRRWCWLFVGLAVVTHFSAVPYVVGLGVVELWSLARRRVPPAEALPAAALLLAPSVPWLAYALSQFGVRGTFLTNSTVTWDATRGAAEKVGQVLSNLAASMVPHPFRSVPPYWAQEYLPGVVRDQAFLIYQTTLPGMMGSLGWAVVAGLLLAGGTRALRAGRVEGAAQLTIFLSTVAFLGIATVPIEDPFGVAHICLQPVAVAGLVYMASAWERLRFGLRALLSVGLFLDASLGVGLQLWLESFTPYEVVALNPASPAVSVTMANNLMAKLQLGYLFLADGSWRNIAIGLTAVALGGLIALVVSRAAEEGRAGCSSPDATQTP